MRTSTLTGESIKPERIAPGVIRCQHCGKTFPRNKKKPNCPKCKKPHGNRQAR